MRKSSPDLLRGVGLASALDDHGRAGGRIRADERLDVATRLEQLFGSETPAKNGDKVAGCIAESHAQRIVCQAQRHRAGIPTRSQLCGDTPKGA